MADGNQQEFVVSQRVCCTKYQWLLYASGNFYSTLESFLLVSPSLPNRDHTAVVSDMFEQCRVGSDSTVPGTVGHRQCYPMTTCFSHAEKNTVMRK
jgi:hypothetical protein